MPTNKTASALEDHLGYWLRYVSNHVSHAFAQKVMGHGVTVAEWVLLREMLESRSANPSQLAAKVGLTRGAVSKLVDRLCDKKLAARRSAAGDKRFHTVRLTADGVRLVPVLARLADANDREFFGHLAAAEKSDFIRLLRDIVRRHGWKETPVD